MDRAQSSFSKAEEQWAGLQQALGSTFASACDARGVQVLHVGCKEICMILSLFRRNGRAPDKFDRWRRGNCLRQDRPTARATVGDRAEECALMWYPEGCVLGPQLRCRSICTK